jgi:tripartite-type tricarboxylate transporter receptor subunit TctC
MNGLSRLLAGGVALLGIASAAPALAQSFPSKPITIITAFGPGSASDTITRVVAQPLSVALKQGVVVEAKVGASGAISAQYVARAPADGYTLLMTTNSPHSAAPYLMKNVGYDPLKDFSFVTRFGSFTLLLCVHPDVPAKSVKELIDYAKKNPGKLAYASGNSAGIIGGATVKHFAQADMVHVPYKSTPQALTDLLAGRVQMMFVDFTTGIPHVKSGALRALAVSRIKRSALFPELPTLDEAGVTGFDMDAWAGFVAPARTPPEVVTLLNREMSKIIDSPETKETLTKVGFEGFSSSPKELEDFVKIQLGKWEKMVKDAGIQPE